jgi:ubiquinone/menaquinone biosynthesis C-methylase UbiE
MIGDGDRLAREREFHDRRYAHDTRAPLDRIYDSTTASETAYRSLLARVQPGDRVLEYGCGLGSLAFELARQGAFVVGIDISSVAVHGARQRAAEDGLTNLAFVVGNAEAVPCADATFDVVVGSGVLHHLDVDHACHELARVLRPSGWAVFLEPLGHNPAVNLFRRLTPSMRTADEHPLRVGDLRRAGQSFRQVNGQYFYLVALGGLALRRLGAGPRVMTALERVDRRLLARVPYLRRHAWTVVLRFEGPRPVGGGTR